MKKRMMVLVLAGFLAGVAFVISCGEGARSLAQEVIRAVEVTFDNTGTGIGATDVQALGIELTARLTALELKVGTLPPPDLVGRVTALEARVECLEGEVYNPTPETSWVVLDSLTGVNKSSTTNLSCVLPIRYLQVSVTYSSDTGQVNIYEIQAFGPDAPTTNLALNKTATAISSQGGDAGGQGPKSAVDGNLSTRWASDRTDPGPASVSVPHWIMVDLGQNYRIDQIVINAGNYNEDYTLLGKRDGN